MRMKMRKLICEERERLSQKPFDSGVGQEVGAPIPQKAQPGGGKTGPTKMVIRIGVRMIHQMALTSLRSQHLEEAGYN